MTYQEQLAIEFMSALAVRASLYVRSEAKYSEFWLNAMDLVFNRTYEEIYGHLPHGY